MENGRPITGHIRHEFHIATRAPGKGDIVRLSYLAVSTDTREARLTVRDRESDARAEIPAGSWEFADSQSIRLLPRGSLFAPLKIYANFNTSGHEFEVPGQVVCYIFTIMKPSDALAAHRGKLRELVTRHGLARARIFGSVLTGTDDEQSDLDLLVDPTETTSLFTLA
ncbi:MAG TPA: nucleotidyltransferase domain-containing protein, partial [Stellaceae bacterium]